MYTQIKPDMDDRGAGHKMTPTGSYERDTGCKAVRDSAQTRRGAALIDNNKLRRVNIYVHFMTWEEVVARSHCQWQDALAEDLSTQTLFKDAVVSPAISHDLRVW